MTNTTSLIGKFLLVAAVLLTLASCASGHIKSGNEYASKGEWSKAVLEYRQANSENPDDIEIKSRLKQTELKAADYYYNLGKKEVAKGNLAGATAFFEQGLLAMPENEKLQSASRDVQLRKNAAAFYQEGIRLLSGGKPEDAKQSFKKSLEAYPGQKEAMLKLAEIEKKESGDAEDGLVLSSSAPITLVFHETDIRDAYEFLAKSFGINVIFDSGLKNVPVTLFAKDVTFEQGLSLLLATSKTFYRKISQYDPGRFGQQGKARPVRR